MKTWGFSSSLVVWDRVQCIKKTDQLGEGKPVIDTKKNEIGKS